MGVSPAPTFSLGAAEGNAPSIADRRTDSRRDGSSPFDQPPHAEPLGARGSTSERELDWEMRHGSGTAPASAGWPSSHSHGDDGARDAGGDAWRWMRQRTPRATPPRSEARGARGGSEEEDDAERGLVWHDSYTGRSRRVSLAHVEALLSARARAPGGGDAPLSPSRAQGGARPARSTSPASSGRAPGAVLLAAQRGDGVPVVRDVPQLETGDGVSALWPLGTWRAMRAQASAPRASLGARSDDAAPVSPSAHARYRTPPLSPGAPPVPRNGGRSRSPDRLDASGGRQRWAETGASGRAGAWASGRAPPYDGSEVGGGSPPPFDLERRRRSPSPASPRGSQAARTRSGHALASRLGDARGRALERAGGDGGESGGTLSGAHARRLSPRAHKVSDAMSHAGVLLDAISRRDARGDSRRGSPDWPGARTPARDAAGASASGARTPASASGVWGASELGRAEAGWSSPFAPRGAPFQRPAQLGGSARAGSPFERARSHGSWDGWTGSRSGGAAHGEGVATGGAWHSEREASYAESGGESDGASGRESGRASAGSASAASSDGRSERHSRRRGGGARTRTRGDVRSPRGARSPSSVGWGPTGTVRVGQSPASAAGGRTPRLDGHRLYGRPRPQSGGRNADAGTSGKWLADEDEGAGSEASEGGRKQRAGGGGAAAVRVKLFVEGAERDELQPMGRALAHEVALRAAGGCAVRWVPAPVPHVRISSALELLAEGAVLHALAIAARECAPDILVLVRWYCAPGGDAPERLRARWEAAVGAVGALADVRLAQAAVSCPPGRRVVDVVLQASEALGGASGAGAGAWPGWGAWPEARLARALGLMLCHVRYGHAEGCGYVLRAPSQLRTVLREHGRPLGVLCAQSGAHAVLVQRPHGTVGEHAPAGRGLLLVFGHRWAASKARALIEQWLRKEQSASAAVFSPAVTLRAPRESGGPSGDNSGSAPEAERGGEDGPGDSE